jgi:hypothetical protein
MLDLFFIGMSNDGIRPLDSPAAWHFSLHAHYFGARTLLPSSSHRHKVIPNQIG